MQTLAAAVITAAAIMFVRAVRPELAPAVSALGGCMLLLAVLQYVAPFFGSFSEISEMTGTSGLMTVMAKALSAALACEMCGGICRDCGEAGMASKVELLGKAYIIMLSLPLLKSLIGLTGEMLK